MGQPELKPLADALGDGTLVEQRGKRRLRVLLSAKVCFGQTMADCTVKNLSATGARIHAPAVLGLPQTVHLLIPRARLIVHSRQIWSDFPCFGLKFLRAEAIDDASDTNVVQLSAWKAWARSTSSA